MVHERWYIQWGQDLNPRPSSHESSALTTRPRLLAISFLLSLCLLALCLFVSLSLCRSVYLSNLFLPNLAQPNLVQPNLAKHVINLPNLAHLN